MSDTSVLSTIELFPTELWCEVFKFFDAVELYHTFDNLNSKITSILSGSTPLYFEIATQTNYDFCSHVILPAVNNASNIRSFKFYEEFQIEEFFTLWPINTFSQLRCLSLVYLGALMSDCSILLLEQLSTLTHFQSFYIQVGYITNQDKCLRRLFQLIFVEKHAFHSLKDFVLRTYNGRDFLSLPVTVKQTNLEFITLPSLHRHEFLQLLPYIPHIKSIKTNWLYCECDKTTLETIPSLDSPLSNCINLNLKLDREWTFEDVEVLLTQVPNINRLELTYHCFLVDENRWEILLTKYCSKLRILELVFSNCYDNTLPILHSTFSAMFWLERNVQVVYNEKVHHFTVRVKM